MSVLYLVVAIVVLAALLSVLWNLATIRIVQKETEQHFADKFQFLYDQVCEPAGSEPLDPGLPIRCSVWSNRQRIAELEKRDGS